MRPPAPVMSISPLTTWRFNPLRFTGDVARPPLHRFHVHRPGDAGDVRLRAHHLDGEGTAGRDPHLQVAHRVVVEVECFFFGHSTFTVTRSPEVSTLRVEAAVEGAGDLDLVLVPAAHVQRAGDRLDADAPVRRSGAALADAPGVRIGARTGRGREQDHEAEGLQRSRRIAGLGAATVAGPRSEFVIIACMRSLLSCLRRIQPGPFESALPLYPICLR